MSDCSLQKVEDLQIGDCLMGIDGQPRQILRLYQGVDQLYRVHQARGISYTVSSNHILSLRENWHEIRKSVPNLGGNTRQRRKYIGASHSRVIVNLALPDYLEKSKKWKRRHKGWKLEGIELPEKQVAIDPYFVGLWLGDGTQGNTNITTADNPVIDYLKWFAVREGVRYVKMNSDPYGHALSRVDTGGSNPIRDILREYGILDNKRIPQNYLNNSKSVRLSLLAGLVDSDGFNTGKNTLAITQVRKELAEDIAWLCRSLGCYTTLRTYKARMKRKDGSVYETDSYRVEFVGEILNQLPLLIDRKRIHCSPLPRRYSSSIMIEPIGIGDYYGFELDGDHLFLLEDFTVTHNTYSALQALITLSSKFNQKLDIDILSESIPHLKGGCIKDFFNILQEVTENNPYYNHEDKIYRCPSWKGVFTFLSADNKKALGMRRDVLFINEGDALPWDVAKELISRTNIFVIIDWNPRSEFWAHEYYLNDPKWAYDHSTYLDALDVIPAGKREDIEDLGRKDPNYYNIYQMGLLGKVESLVYPNFQQVDELPEGFTVYGLDYGFSQDPTVLVKNVIIGDKLYSKEMFYDRSGLTNDQIARKMELAGVRNDPVYPDPDEPKSAEELRRLGFNIQDSVKGKGSVEFGIQKVNQYYQHWTKDSPNCIKEQRNFSYIKDRQTGNITDRTTHTWSHGMDARRYPIASIRTGGITVSIPVSNVTRRAAIAVSNSRRY